MKRNVLFYDDSGLAMTALHQMAVSSIKKDTWFVDATNCVQSNGIHAIVAHGKSVPIPSIVERVPALLIVGDRVLYSREMIDYILNPNTQMGSHVTQPGRFGQLQPPQTLQIPPQYQQPPQQQQPQQTLQIPPQYQQPQQTLQIPQQTLQIPQAAPQIPQIPQPYSSQPQPFTGSGANQPGQTPQPQIPTQPGQSGQLTKELPPELQPIHVGKSPDSDKEFTQRLDQRNAERSAF